MRRVPAFLVLLLLAGCGGDRGGSPSSVAFGKGKGRAVLTIRWPDRTAVRLIPNSANAIVVTLAQGTTVVTKKTIPRPTDGTATTATTFSGLAYTTPDHPYTVTAQAYPNADGTGVAQAVGGGPMAVTEDTPGTIAVTMASTVKTLALSSIDPLYLDDKATVSATAYDASGAIVLLSSGGGSEPLVWKSSLSSVVAVAANGLSATVQAMGPGTADVSASLKLSDAGTTATGTTPVSVANVCRLVIQPSDAKTTENNIVHIPSPSQSSYFVPGLSDGVIGTSYIGYSAALVRYWRAVFPIAGIPAGAIIQSATFGANIDANASAAPHTIYTYTSTTDQVAGLLPSLVKIGDTPGAIGLKTVDATDVVRSQIAAGTLYLGFFVTLSSPITFDPGGMTSWSSPKLTILYTKP